MSPIVGVDLGERRIGVAVASEVTDVARPLGTLRRATTVAGDLEALRVLLGGADPDELVVGLPLEASGLEGPQVRLTRLWAGDVERLTGWPIRFRDERLSSHLAEQRLGPMKRGRSGGPPTPTQRRAYRARVDREAAAIILQDELDARVHGAT